MLQLSTDKSNVYATAKYTEAEFQNNGVQEPFQDGNDTDYTQN